MEKKTIGVISYDNSDLLDILKANDLNIKVMKPGALVREELEACYSIAILAGTRNEPLIFHPRERVFVEELLDKGRRVFAEYCASIGNVYNQDASSTRFDRLCFCHDTIKIKGIGMGEILDDQCNSRIKPWDISCSRKRPLLQYVRSNTHDRIDVTEKLLENTDERGIWFDEPENLLICAFRISNFIKARFSPLKKWRFLVKYILEWLCDGEVDVDCAGNAYSLAGYNAGMPMEQQLLQCISSGISWLEGNGILLDDGRNGCLEGIATEIYPDGIQRIIPTVRTDCTGEVGFSYFLKYLLDRDAKNLEKTDALMSFCFDIMQIKDNGPFKGMLRWSYQAWKVCYQDDAARVLIPQLLKCLFTGSRRYLDECTEALRFMLRTTGTDGLRIMRTDNINLTGEMFQKLSSEPANFPSAHYNGFYMAALLLAYKLTGLEEFRLAGIKGLETIMSVYPETKREQSETQELCRLVLPLSYLYWVTKDEKHKRWLYRVASDLQRYRHASGAYLEWDSGYKASRFNTNNDECSLLTRNGDPVVDMLYSLNWLPAGFIQAFFITGDRWFRDLWEDIAQFMISVQIRSSNKQINGGWTRALDVNLMEVFALPNDLGWGPWAIESGWTVAEITAGLAMGLLEDQLKKFYDNRE